MKKQQKQDFRIFCQDFEICGAISGKRMTFGLPPKVPKLSSDCLLCPIGPFRLYLLTVKKLQQKTSQKNFIFLSISNFESFQILVGLMKRFNFKIGHR